MTLLDKAFLVFIVFMSLYGHYRLYVDGCENWKRLEKRNAPPKMLPTAPALREFGDRKFAPYYCGTVFVKFVDVSQKENKE